MVAEEADGLDDDGLVAGFGEGFQRVFDGGADPRCAGDALALEGEEPVGIGHANRMHAVRDSGGSLFAFDGVWVRLRSRRP